MPHRVLIADDDKALLTSISVRLQAEGYEVVAVQDSYQAVDQARKFQPDVLVLDINMPAGDGFSVQSRVERMSPLGSVPVIYLTGERSERVKTLAKTRHAAALIFKPFTTPDLLAAIKEAISSSKAAQAA